MLKFTPYAGCGTFNTGRTWSDYMDRLCTDAMADKIPFSWLSGTYFL